METACRHLEPPGPQTSPDDALVDDSGVGGQHVVVRLIDLNVAQRAEQLDTCVERAGQIADLGCAIDRFRSTSLILRLSPALAEVVGFHLGGELGRLDPEVPLMGFAVRVHQEGHHAG